jgi:hypothetical protein
MAHTAFGRSLGPLPPFLWIEHHVILSKAKNLKILHCVQDDRGF